MKLQEFQDRIYQPARKWEIAVAAILVLIGLNGIRRWIDRHIETAQQEAHVLIHQAQPLDQAQEHFEQLRQLKAHDVEQFKTGFADLAKTRKTLFESGLSLQEERRLLEKQLEIMTTYLSIDPALQRIFLMRGEQPLQSYRVTYVPPRLFPDSSALVTTSTGQTMSVPTMPPPVPYMVRIISKERFAHPERGKSEEVNGKLQYEPPQVGTSVRSNALGEYVIFTNSRLILHGPPLNEADHEKFPHLCLGLDLDTARALYRNSFIGTKILLKARDH